MKLSDVTFTLSATGKITVAHYAGIDVEAVDLQGTLLRVQTFCSTSTWNIFLRWIGGRDAPNLDKGNQFFTILFCLKYHPNDEWEMDEDVEGEWDAAVESLMDQLSSN